MYVREMEHFLHAAVSGHSGMNDIGRAATTTALALQVLEFFFFEFNMADAANGGPRPHTIVRSPRMFREFMHNF